MVTNASLETALDISLFSPEEKVTRGGGIKIEPNALRGTPFHNSAFCGEVLFLNVPYPPAPDDKWAYAEHFRTKQRRFEFRLQGTFLVDPGEDVFFGIEFTDHICLSPTLRLSASWLMTVVKTLCAARGITCSYSFDKQTLPDNDELHPHLAFPIHAADTIIATPPGETPPDLSQSLTQMSFAEKKTISLNTRDTFTFAYWSKNADFMRWKIVGMPFDWSSDFSTFIGTQDVHFTAYSLMNAGAAHSQRAKQYFSRMVLSRKTPQVQQTSSSQPKNRRKTSRAVKIPTLTTIPAHGDDLLATSSQISLRELNEELARIGNTDEVSAEWMRMELARANPDYNISSSRSILDMILGPIGCCASTGGRHVGS